MEYSELKPAPSVFKLDGIEYTLRAFDLNARVWADSYFATEKEPRGIQVLAQRLNDFSDFVPCLKTCWHLLSREDQMSIGGFDSFVKMIEKEGKYTKIGELYKCLTECLGVSEPMIEQVQQDIELKKRLAATL